MLREALTWLSASATPAARKMGYLKAAIGIESRAMRCRDAWAGHLERSRQAVVQSAARCEQRRTALVLGSGLGLEYPLEALAAQFRRVVLVDIVHLPAQRRHAARHANVELVACDLSGLADTLLEIPHDVLPEAIDALVPGAPAIDTDGVDWVVSCNLLSQLPLLPVAWLGRRCPQLEEAVLERCGRKIMARHLDWLAAFDAERCLVADAEQTVRDRQGRIAEHADIAAAFDLDHHAYASWEWRIAPPGELPDGLSASHRVVACRWPAARQPE